jgi:2-keto-4-pentenoate hydratase
VDLRAEAEIAIEVGTDGAIAGYGAAIELVDVGRPPSSAVEGIVAGNIFHRAFVLGSSQPGRPSGEARLVIGGTVRDAAPIGGDFEATVDHVARHLAAVGEGLDRGDVIIAGALAHVPVAPGDEVVVEIGDLGPLQVAIAA